MKIHSVVTLILSLLWKVIVKIAPRTRANSLKVLIHM
jgi:hypothetical protein